MPVKLRSGKLLEEEIPTKQSRLVKKSNTGWFDLPFEMREMIIDEMDPKTRCRFAKCSKQCDKEAKESNNYLDSIRVEKSWINMFVELRYEETEDSFHKVYFSNINDVKIYENHKNTVTLLVEGDLEEAVARFVQENAEKYRKSLRKLEVYGRDYNSFVPIINFNILRKLEKIQMYFDNVAEFSSIIGCEQILHTLKYVTLPQFNFTFDQIMKFEGIKLHCSSNEMDEENVKKYLKMLKNGEVHQNIKSIRIHMNDEKDVDFVNVIDSLDAKNFESSEYRCIFNMTSESEKNKSRFITVLYQPTGMFDVNINSIDIL